LLFKVLEPRRIVENGALCGVAAFAYSVMRQEPFLYVKYVTDLFDLGWANLPNGTCTIKPSNEFRLTPKPPDIPDDPADYIALGSLRDCENFWKWKQTHGALHGRGYKYQSPWEKEAIGNNSEQKSLTNAAIAAGATSIEEVEKWFRAFGFPDVHYLGRPWAGLGALEQASKLYEQNHRVVLFINLACLNPSREGLENARKGGDGNFNHVIALASRITFSPFTFRYYEPGKEETFRTQMTKEEFCNSFHGYVAASMQKNCGK
jgi:hypothetical protein